MKLEVGKYYRTYGGWKAVVIWKVYAGLNQKEHYLVIHKPYDEDESHVVSYNTEGESLTAFSINEPPRYNEHHPADIKEEWPDEKELIKFIKATKNVCLKHKVK